MTMIISHSFNSKRLLSIFFFFFCLSCFQVNDVVMSLASCLQSLKLLNTYDHLRRIIFMDLARTAQPPVGILKDGCQTVSVCHLSVWVSPFQLLCQIRSSNTFTSFSFNCLSNLSHLFQLSY